MQWWPLWATVHKTIMVTNILGLFFLVISLYFFWHAQARISGVRRTKHDVLPNKRSVMASNSFHRQCLQLEPFCKVCGAWFNENWKKIFAMTTMQPSSTFFGVNTAEDKFILKWSPANICYNTLILIVAFPKKISIVLTRTTPAIQM